MSTHLKITVISILVIFGLIIVIRALLTPNTTNYEESPSTSTTNTIAAPSSKLSTQDEIYALVCVGMSNASQECEDWMQKVAGPLKNQINDQLVIINCAVGGHAIERWNDSANDSLLWDACIQKVQENNLDITQVRFIWHKAMVQDVLDAERNMLPPYPHPDSAYFKLYAELDMFAVRLPQKFPSVEKVFMSGRSYSGFAKRPDRGEPLGFQANEAIEAWVAQNPYKETIKYAVGPYLWAPDCADVQDDTFCYELEDYKRDGIHPDTGAKNKISRILHNYFLQFSWYGQ